MDCTMYRLEWMAKTHAIEILESLSNSDEKFYGELTEAIKTKNYGTLNKTIEFLKENKLIDYRKEEKTDKGRKIGLKKYFWLTDKGKQITKYLIKIEKIMGAK